MEENKEKYRLKVGDKIQLGDGPAYEILDFYFTTEEVASWNAIVEFRNLETNEIESLLVCDVLELLKNGNLYRPNSELGKWYYENVAKPKITVKV